MSKGSKRVISRQCVFRTKYSPTFAPGVSDPLWLHLAILGTLRAFTFFPDTGVWGGKLGLEVRPPKPPSKSAPSLLRFNG